MKKTDKHSMHSNAYMFVFVSGASCDREWDQSKPKSKSELHQCMLSGFVNSVKKNFLAPMLDRFVWFVSSSISSDRSSPRAHREKEWGRGWEKEKKR